MRIALWNANGLAQHKFELELFLKQQQIDVMLISETHFTENTTSKYTATTSTTPNTPVERHTAAPEWSSNPALSTTSFLHSRKTTFKSQA